MLLKQLIPLALVLFLTGCANAITYHHSERVSIALEARSTDPQQPVQGIIGIKTRTVVVSPGVKGAEAESTSTDKPEQVSKSEDMGKTKSTALGESASVISDFKLSRETNEFWNFGTTKIKSAFITGEAAKNAPKASTKALSGIGVDAIGDAGTLKRAMMSNIYEQLKLIQDADAKAKEHVERLDKLAELLPEKYNETGTYYTFSKKKHLLEKRDMTKYKLSDDKFIQAVEYEKELLIGSIQSLKFMVDDRTAKYKEDSAGVAIDISKEKIEELKKEQKRLSEARKTFFNLIGNHDAIDMAATYAISSL